MTKSFKLFSQSIAICLLTSVVAINIASADEDNTGTTLLKIRAYISAPSDKDKVPNLAQTNLVRTGNKLLHSGVGGEISSTYFIDQNLAAELSLGVTGYKSKDDYIASASTAAIPYSNNSNASTKNRRIAFIPLTATVQYHINPTNQFSPYIGAGYHYAFNKNPAKTVTKFSNSNGPVIQAGFDVWDKEGIGFTVDIKKYWGKSTVTHNNILDASGKALKSKVNIDPVVVGAGIGWVF
jgi:outer membrane protein